MSKGAGLMDAAMWIPGRRRLTNGMLSDLRAAGFYAGRSRGGKLRGGFDKFAAETNAIRTLVCTEAWRLDWPDLCGAGPVDVTLYVVGHHKHDPDAWYLLAKAAIDGLVDAGVLSSDRREVRRVEGRVAQTLAEERMIAPRPDVSGPGFVLALRGGALP